jgi:Putative metal-binding motif/Dictyostelium (slime mold) repeat
MLLRRALPALALLFGALGCGAKSGLFEPPPSSSKDAGPLPDAEPDAQPDAAECVTDQDCPTSDLCNVQGCVQGHCVTVSTVPCNDNDPCTKDTCDPKTGQCQFTPLTLDQDGDGYRAPLPGFAPGAPGSCGDDCDDTNPNAHPGGIEVCDGVDNDCNGIVDDNMRYSPTSGADVLVSSGNNQQGGSAGLAYNGKLYGATYGSQFQHWRNEFKGLLSDGTISVPETPITDVDNDSFSGPIVWTGAMFGTVWEDRRNGNYEIYFNRLDPHGKKLAADVRITDAGGFSLHPYLVWNGLQFLVVWDDTRSNYAALYGQRIDVDGKPIGHNMALTGPTLNAESPVLAKGTTTLGMAFNNGDATDERIELMLLKPDLTPLPNPPVVLAGDGGTPPVIVFNKDRYVVAWATRNTVPGDAIWAASVDETGKIVTPATRVTSGANFARTPSLLALGDRLLMVWADDHDGNYELYTKMLAPDLSELWPRQRITNDPHDTFNPIPAFGPQGDVGILFDDDRSGNWQSYFTHLVCQAGNP